MLRTEAASKEGQIREGLISVAARGTVKLLIARGFLLITGYLITVTLARRLGPTDYGVYGVILSLLVWVEGAATSGISRAIPKHMAQHENEVSEFNQTAPTLMFLVAVTLFLPCWWLAPTLAHLFQIPEGTTLFRLALLDLPFSGMYFAYLSLLTGYRRFGELSASLIIYGSTHLVGIFCLLLFVGLSIAGALLVNVAATVGTLVYLVAKLPPKHWRPAYPLVIPLLRTAIPFTLLIVASHLLASLDLWALKSLWKGSGEVVGVYVAALKVAMMFFIVPIAVGDVLFPSLSWALAQKEEWLAQRHIQAATRFTLIVLFPACVLLGQHAEGVMTLLYSEVYASGGTYLRLLLIATMLFAFLNIFIINALPAAGKYHQSVGLELSLIPVASLLYFLFIPGFGAVGAAASFALIVLLGTTIAAFFAYRRFGSLIRLSAVGRVIMATTVMALVGYYLPGFGLWLLPKFALLLSLYVLLLALSKEVTREDLMAFALWQKDGQPVRAAGAEPDASSSS